ncbi:MAG: hypothetical protein AAGE83_06830 [Pseudomonadota bacterium]
MFRLVGHAALVAALTLLTQIGGVAWLVALVFRRRLLVFVLVYAALSAGAYAAAPLTGRVTLPCFGDGPLRMHSLLYCVLNRHYASPDLARVLEDVATAMADRHPGTVTEVLDANFPFIDGFPRLPHLSHNDGGSADLAYWYGDGKRYLRGATPSPIGYFAFEPGSTDCPDRWPTLRWDLDWLQPLWPALGRDRVLDDARLATAARLLAADPRLGKIFIEPHLVSRLGIAHPKIRFQGCRAARHDDHIHVQLP